MQLKEEEIVDALSRKYIVRIFSFLSDFWIELRGKTFSNEIAALTAA